MLRKILVQGNNLVLTNIAEPAPAALLSFLDGQTPQAAVSRDGTPPRKRRKVEDDSTAAQITSKGAREYLTLARADIDIVSLCDTSEQSVDG